MTFYSFMNIVNMSFKVLALLSLALAISQSQCTGVCWEVALEPIKLPFILSGVCSPSVANYCANPFEVFLYFLQNFRHCFWIWELVFLLCILLQNLWHCFQHLEKSFQEGPSGASQSTQIRLLWWHVWFDLSQWCMCSLEFCRYVVKQFFKKSTF